MENENDKLIAEFMGVEILAGNNYNSFNNIYKTKNKTAHHTMSDGRLFYENHSASRPPEYRVRWDWLMPVVDKLYHKIPSSKDSDLFIDELRECLPTANIEVVYEKVIKFIKWYNENK